MLEPNSVPVAVAAAKTGAVLVNAIPHVVSGVSGLPFQTPFAKPPGQGPSSATVKVLWGFCNIAIGYLLVCRVGAFALRDEKGAAALGLGMLATALPLARFFGRFHGGNAPEHR